MARDGGALLPRLLGVFVPWLSESASSRGWTDNLVGKGLHLEGEARCSRYPTPFPRDSVRNTMAPVLTWVGRRRA
jgi:hypothetical protein